MTTRPDDLLAMWSVLRADPEHELTGAPLLTRIGQVPARVAVDRNGARHLLIAWPGSGGDVRVWRASAVSLHRRSLDGGDDAGRWLDVECRSAELDAAFANLCAYLLERLLRSPVPLLEANTIAALDEWKALFGGSVLEPSVTGMLAELLVLQDLARYSPVAALEAWQGPRGGRHDFRRGCHAAEVKGTLHPVAESVTIHGVTQLVPPAGGTLHLIRVRLERVARGSVSLSALERSLIAAGVPPGGLAEIVESTGIADLAARVREQSYEVRGVDWFAVDEHFPTIVPAAFIGGSLPAGVTDVSYQVDLGLVSKLAENEQRLAASRLLGIAVG